MVGQVPPDITREEQDPKKFKTQPWTLYDTVASHSFLLGDVDTPAIGSSDPAINGAGELVFFGAGRTKVSQPQLTNFDKSGELSFGMWVYQIYLMLLMPLVRAEPNNNVPGEAAGMSGPDMLSQAIINWSAMILDLGQEEQMHWPTHRFGAGGGLADQTVGGTTGSVSTPQNGLQVSINVLKLPEPIAMVKGDPVSARIKIAPFVHALIGTVAAPGVGWPLVDYKYSITVPADPPEPPVVYDLPMPPFGVQLGLQGKRVKRTQYGQIPGVPG